MAIVKCHECSRDVSTEAKSCPACGAKVKKPTSKLTWALGGLFAIAIFSTIGQKQEVQSKAAAAEAAKTPEQRAREAAAAKLRTDRMQVAAAAALTIKRSMKDPDAFELKQVLLMPSGSVCLSYRAKNSFGAILPGDAVLIPPARILVEERDGNAFVSAWNKACAKSSGEVITTEVSAML